MDYPFQSIYVYHESLNWECYRGATGKFFWGGKVIFLDFFPGMKFFFLVENFHFCRPKTNFRHFWKVKSKKKKPKQNKKQKNKTKNKQTNKQNKNKTKQNPPRKSSPHFGTFASSHFQFPSPFPPFSMPLFSL